LLQLNVYSMLSTHAICLGSKSAIYSTSMEIANISSALLGWLTCADMVSPSMGPTGITWAPKQNAQQWEGVSGCSGFSMYT